MIMLAVKLEHDVDYSVVVKHLGKPPFLFYIF